MFLLSFEALFFFQQLIFSALGFLFLLFTRTVLEDNFEVLCPNCTECVKQLKSALQKLSLGTVMANEEILNVYGWVAHMLRLFTIMAVFRIERELIHFLPLSLFHSKYHLCALEDRWDERLNNGQCSRFPYSVTINRIETPPPVSRPALAWRQGPCLFFWTVAYMWHLNLRDESLLMDRYLDHWTRKLFVFNKSILQ